MARCGLADARRRAQRKIPTPIDKKQEHRQYCNLATRTERPRQATRDATGGAQPHATTPAKSFLIHSRLPHLQGGSRRNIARSLCLTIFSCPYSETAPHFEASRSRPLESTK